MSDKNWKLKCEKWKMKREERKEKNLKFKMWKVMKMKYKKIIE